MQIERYKSKCKIEAEKLETSPEIHPDDLIFQFVLEQAFPSNEDKGVEYYFRNGLESAQKLLYLLNNICGYDGKNEIEILEFASGFGCVTRHLKNVIPFAKVTACDIHPQAGQFITEKLSTRFVLSTSRPEDLVLGQKFDVVFALSFFSHMPKSSFSRWLRRLVSFINPGGFLIFTTHGVKSKKLLPDGQFDEDGFYFVPSSEQHDINTSDYGLAATLPEFVTSQIFGDPTCRLEYLHEAYWWGHQDVYIVSQNKNEAVLAVSQRNTENDKESQPLSDNKDQVLSGSTRNLDEDRSNKEFIDFCFKNILGREPDEKGATEYTNALNFNTLSREDVLVQFVTSAEFKNRLGNINYEFVPSGHYYSAVPSMEDRQAFLKSPRNVEEILGVNLNVNEQFKLLQRFKDYYIECPFQDIKSGSLRYYYQNPSYSYTDALTLYSMMREFKPRRMIEIGSGFSSCVMLDTSELFLDDRINFTFIEPYPELLYSLIRKQDEKHAILPKKLQDVDVNIFNSLDANDILFIDSTHVSKLGSDVNRIIFEILPILKKGVLVHFHDIFWPFEYPLDWIKKGISWNEAYLLHAFLEFNECFRIIFFSSFLHKHHHSWFQENMPLYLKNTGGNIWLGKK